MVSIYINQALVADFVADSPSWKDVKAFLEKKSATHAFVVSGKQKWNVFLRNGRLTKSKAA